MRAIDVKRSIALQVEWSPMRSLVPVALVLLIISSTACRRTARTTPPTQPTPLAATPTIIDEVGRYTVDSAGLELAVYLVGNIVNYDLRSANGKETLLSGNAGSKYSRWYFHWSPEGELWVYSGDIGTSVWTLDEGGSYKRQSASPENTAIVRRMPNAFFDAASKGTQERWSAVRNSK